MRNTVLFIVLVLLVGCSSFQPLRVNVGPGDAFRLKNRSNKHLYKIEAWDATNRVYLWDVSTNRPTKMPETVSFGLVPYGMKQVFPKPGSLPLLPPMGTKIVYRLQYQTEYPSIGPALGFAMQAVRREDEGAKTVRMDKIDREAPSWRSQSERDAFIVAIGHEVRDQAPFFLDVATNGAGTDADKQAVRALMKLIGIENPFQAYQELRGVNSIVLSSSGPKGLINEQPLTSVRPLTSFTNLRSLVLSNNRLNDITPLASLVNLEFLRIDGNPLEDITPIMNLPKLKILDVSYSPNVRLELLQEISSKGVRVWDSGRESGSALSLEFKDHAPGDEDGAKVGTSHP